jgi:hypothetical protein
MLHGSLMQTSAPASPTRFVVKDVGSRLRYQRLRGSGLQAVHSHNWPAVLFNALACMHTTMTARRSHTERTDFNGRSRGPVLAAENRVAGHAEEQACATLRLPRNSVLQGSGCSARRTGTQALRPSGSSNATTCARPIWSITLAPLPETSLSTSVHVLRTGGLTACNASKTLQVRCQCLLATAWPRIR